MNIDKKTPQLIVMLTYNDYTTEEAEKIFEECYSTPSQENSAFSPIQMNGGIIN